MKVEQGMTAETDVRVVPATEKDEDEIFKFLLENFFTDEPLNSCMKRVPTKDTFIPLSCVTNGYSFIAYVCDSDGTARMAGVVLNKISRRGDRRADIPTEEKARKIFLFLSELNKKADVWSRVTCDEVFYTVILSVSKDYRGLKIGKKLIETSLEKAASCGLTHATVECSSFYSARIVEGLGYERISELRYDQHRNENGEVVFKVEKPHEVLAMFLKTV